jgi:hypothetical protein
MPRRVYYRRQADLCLQLSLVQNDPQTTVLLAGFAKELQAKADDEAKAPDGAVAPISPDADWADVDWGGMEANTYVKPLDRPRPRREPENPKV